jgi:hypothetical protein
MCADDLYEEARKNGDLGSNQYERKQQTLIDIAEATVMNSAN